MNNNWRSFEPTTAARVKTNEASNAEDSAG
jgi:hypothetical protein